jgi:hypothetical protein
MRAARAGAADRVAALLRAPGIAARARARGGPIVHALRAGAMSLNGTL